MKHDQVFKSIKAAIDGAPRNAYVAELHLQVIKHSDVLQEVTGNEFCAALGIGDSFGTKKRAAIKAHLSARHARPWAGHLPQPPARREAPQAPRSPSSSLSFAATSRPSAADRALKVATRSFASLRRLRYQTRILGCLSFHAFCNLH
jgi:hypothetical protein